MLDFSIFNLSKCNISSKKNFLNVGPKLFYLGIFGLELKKATILWFFYISTLKFFQSKFCPKIKILKFETKIVLIVYFELEFQKTNVEFEITILEFVNMQSFIQKQNIFKIGTLLRYFFCCNFTKTIIKLLISTLEFMKL